MPNINKNKKYHFIYKTTNQLNGKYYIGMHSTSNLKDGYVGSGTRLKRAIKKYGIKNFKFEILEYCDTRELLVERERSIVNSSLIDDPACMNLRLGGLGGVCNASHAAALKKAASTFLTNKWLNDDFRATQATLKAARLKKVHASGKFKYDNFRGKHHTDETKKLIGLKNSQHQSGVNNSQYGTCWITNGNQNKKIKRTDVVPIGWYFGRTIKLK